MADNVGYTPGSGATVAADEIGGVLYQRAKVVVGEDGVATDVSQANPMPMAAVGELIEAIEALRMTVHSLTRSVGLAMPDTAGRLRVNVETGAVTASLAVNQTLAALSTLANQTNVGGQPATEQIPSLMRVAADALRRNVTVT
jgi:hypothetical protein